MGAAVAREDVARGGYSPSPTSSPSACAPRAPTRSQMGRTARAAGTTRTPLGYRGRPPAPGSALGYPPNNRGGRGVQAGVTGRSCTPPSIRHHVMLGGVKTAGVGRAQTRVPGGQAPACHPRVATGPEHAPMQHDANDVKGSGAAYRVGTRRSSLQSEIPVGPPKPLRLSPFPW